jgi:hypothetical protein
VRRSGILLFLAVDGCANGHKPVGQRCDRPVRESKTTAPSDSLATRRESPLWGSQPPAPEIIAGNVGDYTGFMSGGRLNSLPA